MFWADTYVLAGLATWAGLLLTIKQTGPGERVPFLHVLVITALLASVWPLAVVWVLFDRQEEPYGGDDREDT